MKDFPEAAARSETERAISTEGEESMRNERNALRDATSILLLFQGTTCPLRRIKRTSPLDASQFDSSPVFPTGRLKTKLLATS